MTILTINFLPARSLQDGSIIILQADTLHWSKLFPSMPTKHCWTTYFSNEQVSIVAGGCGTTPEEKALHKMEVMDI